MKKIGLFLFTLVLVFSLGCGQSGKNKQGTGQGQDKGAIQEPGQGGPGQGGPGGMGEGRGQLSPEDMATRQTEQMGEYLKFTDEQKTKVYELNLSNAKKTQELRSGVSFRDMSDSERQAFREKMNAQQEEKNQELKKILTEDQFKAYEKNMEEMRQRMRERMQQRPPQ
jgi:periplasmic protein CpxP/Spy